MKNENNFTPHKHTHTHTQNRHAFQKNIFEWNEYAFVMLRFPCKDEFRYFMLLGSFNFFLAFINVDERKEKSFERSKI